MTRQERWRERNPIASWAHMATRSAIRRGLLRKRPCQQCGEPNAEGHHPDYKTPLRVIWLCRACHKAHHAGRGDGEQGASGDLFAGGVA